MVAAATRDGRVLILDAASLGGANHATPLVASPSLGAGFTPDALSTWESQGTRWLLAPNNGITAYRVVDRGGALILEQGWTSSTLAAPTAPIVVNGVVFAAASGRPNARAVLYAFDGTTGRDLWNSGQTMTSSVTPNGLWASNSQVHAATLDGTVYAFGVRPRTEGTIGHLVSLCAYADMAGHRDLVAEHEISKIITNPQTKSAPATATDGL